MAEILLKGKEVPLLFTTYEMKEIQDALGPISRVFTLITGKNPDDEKDESSYGSAAHIGAVAATVRILGNAGLEEAGETAYLTDKFVMRALRPVNLVQAINACVQALNEGMMSEIPAKDEDGPVDVTLEEMKKKETKES